MDNTQIALIVCFAAAVALCIIGFILYLKRLPKSERETRIKAWLLYAVSKAQEDLKTDTGELKLVTVYDLFLSKFPVMSRLISYRIFKLLVDKALVKMWDMINNNEAIKAVIEKGGE